ncbi:MAG: phosphomethylpyrimidine kinase [Arcobacter sp.]|nr:phosphomethylpyrimidine kinase [Arcobacter sp.]
MNLSKSLYTKGIQCPKALWLKKYNKEVLTPPDETALARFETGNIVGGLACNLFPNGIEIPYTTNFDEMIEQTVKYIDDGIKYIYEATFNFNGILVLVDVLEIHEDNTVSIYEVKSSSSVKAIYVYDTSIQYYVLEQMGFTIKTTNVVHVNSSYVRDDVLELDELFIIANITDEVVELQDNIPTILDEFEIVLKDKTNEPNIDIGKHCHNPYVCDAKDYCWKRQRQIPEHSIFNIFNLGSKKQIELYNQGIVNIEDIPDDFTMTANQKQTVENYKSKETFINKEKIKEFVDTLTYPIYHLDFETFQQAIPEWKGISPYQQIPFQYSLHIEYEDGTLEHKEYLAQDDIDPREQISKRLVKDIPRDVTVLAYNMSFEKGVIKRLADIYPELSTHLLSINENMKDLMIPFQKKYYVTPSMNGSYSIKYVLPALVPELAKAYKELNGVQNGSQAMNAFANMSKIEEDEKQKMRTSLLEYCKLDTLAMVKILERLKEID